MRAEIRPLVHGGHSRGIPGVPVTRPIVLLERGRRHGPITRLITPWRIGELTTPFVFLDHAEIAGGSQSLCGVQPDSAIASLTVVLEGAVSFEDATGVRGEVGAGGLVWMKAANGIWRGSASAELRVLQLWISLPSSCTNSPGITQGITAREVAADGTARVLLGQLGSARSHVRSAPPDINCLHVRLKHGQRWRYTAPDGHNVTWLAVDRGGLQLQLGERVHAQRIAVFADSPGVVEAQAEGDTSFLLGSAPRAMQRA